MRFLLPAITVLILALSFYIGLMTGPNFYNTQSKEIVIVKDKPTVYLNFERFGEYQSPCGEEKSPGIWLRLNNNTGWAIYIEGSPVKENSEDIIPVKLNDNSQCRGVKNNTEMRMRYDFEAVRITETKNVNGTTYLFSPVEVPLPEQSKYCSQKWMGGEVGRDQGFWIAPGNSILFSIPKSLLTNKLRVNVQYNYEWEATDGQIRDFEPHHLVYFYGSNLPPSSNTQK